MRIPKILLVSLLSGCVLQPVSKDHTIQEIKAKVVERGENRNVESIIEELERLPDNYQKIGNKHGTIVIVNGPLTDQVEWAKYYRKTHPTAGKWSKIPGAYDIKTKQAFIRSDIKKKLLALHEYGHLIDYALGQISAHSEFTYAYMLYTRDSYQYSNTLSKHYKSNRLEFFAHCFSKYFYSTNEREELKERFPNVHEFFKKLDKEVKQKKPKTLKRKSKFLD